jgi:hypothetical protein
LALGNASTNTTRTPASAKRSGRSAVALETPTAAIKVTRPKEVALYIAMFSSLQTEAVLGEKARRLIAKARAAL